MMSAVTLLEPLLCGAWEAVASGASVEATIGVGPTAAIAISGLGLDAALATVGLVTVDGGGLVPGLTAGCAACAA